MNSSEFQWPDGIRAAVSLSFDDARRSQPDAGFAVLDRHGVHGTFYVSLGGVDARLEAWRAAASRGHEIGNHSLTHPCSGNFPFARKNALEDYTLDRMEKELLDANEAIRQRLGVTPRTYAYPCGQTYVGRGRDQKSYVPVVARHFLVGRHAFNEIANDPAFCDLAQATSLNLDGRAWDQARGMIESAAADGRWLIFMGHEVQPPAYQAVSPETLDKVCEYCRDPANGIWIDTVARIGEYIHRQRGS